MKNDVRKVMQRAAVIFGAILFANNSYAAIVAYQVDVLGYMPGDFQSSNDAYLTAVLNYATGNPSGGYMQQYGATTYVDGITLARNQYNVSNGFSGYDATLSGAISESYVISITDGYAETYIAAPMVSNSMYSEFVLNFYAATLASSSAWNTTSYISALNSERLNPTYGINPSNFSASVPEISSSGAVVSAVAMISIILLFYELLACNLRFKSKKISMTK